MEAGVGDSVPMPQGAKPCRGFLEVAPFVVDHMQLIDMTSLRRTCREARAVADATIGTVLVTNLHLPAGKTQGSVAHSRAWDARQFAAFVRGILSRGATLESLHLHPVVGDGRAARERRDAPENEDAALEILSTFCQYHTQRPPSLRPEPHASLAYLSLCNVPYTTALASAVHSAAPHLSSLDIASDLSELEDLDAATPGLSRLITTCAASLTSLTFGHDLHSVPQPLADAIAACSRLRHLQLSLRGMCCFDEDGEECDEAYQQEELQSMQHLSQVFSALPALRSLDFERHNLLVPAEVGISSLTRLTNLRFNGLDLASVKDLVADVLSPLRHLACLTLDGNGEIYGADMRLLAAECSQLTCLTFEDQQSHTDLTGGGQGGRRRSCVPLPAALRELHLSSTVRPCDLLALQLPPGLTRLVAERLHASCSDARRYQADAGAGGPAARGGGHGRAVAVGAGGGASSSTATLPPTGAGAAVQPSPCPGFDDLLEAVRLLHERGGGDCEVLVLWHTWDPSPLMWPPTGDGHVRLFAALRPLRLKRLVLGNCVLELGDVMALVEQLTELEKLVLRCQLHPAAVPLLARLPHLAELDLNLPRDRVMDTWLSSGTAVSAGLMPLLLGAPSLKTVNIAFMCRTTPSDDDYEAPEYALLDGVLWVRAQLQRLGRDPRMITMQT